MEILASSRSDETSAGEELMSATSNVADKSPSCFGLIESDLLAWVEAAEESNDDVVRVPPVDMVLHPDLLTKAWGWKRVLPYTAGPVQWHEFKKYLEDYLKLTPEKVATGIDDLRVAVKKCVEMENKLIRTCIDYLDFEAIGLSAKIKVRARNVIQSESEYPAAAVALMCITTEAELMCELLSRDYEMSETVTFSSKICQSASNLMLYKGSESANAAAAAMVGIAKEAKIILDSLRREDPSALMVILFGEDIRKRTATVLTKLEEELFCSTTCNAGTLTSGTSEKPIGVSTDGDLKCEGSDSMGNSKRETNEH